MKELRLQDKIIESVKSHGGHGRKWSSQFQVGMPDLLLSLPLHSLFLAEVKIIKQGKNIADHGLTKKQAHELKLWNFGGGRAILLTGIVDGRALHLVGTDRLQKVTRENALEHAIITWTIKEKFDISFLIEEMKDRNQWPIV